MTLYWLKNEHGGLPQIDTILNVNLYEDLTKKMSDLHTLKSMEGQETKKEEEIENLINKKL